MKLVGYQQDGKTMLGALREDQNVYEIAEINAFWENPDAALEAAASRSAGALSTLAQKPAVPLTARVFVVGLNYRKHVEETNSEIPTTPVIIARWARTLVASGAPVPAIGEQFDWEGELGVVVGKRLFRVDRQQAMAGIFGYAAFNDLSARDLQMATSQWTLGKNTESSGPMGAIVTADEVGDPAVGLRLTTRVNGEMYQDSTTADLIFTVDELVSRLSQSMILQPGDFIATGTPSGVGLATGRFLHPGDVVEVEIDRVGVLTTPIVAAPAPIA